MCFDLFVGLRSYAFSKETYIEHLGSVGITIDLTSEGAKFLDEIDGLPVRVRSPMLGHVLYEDEYIPVKPEFCVVNEEYDW